MKKITDLKAYLSKIPDGKEVYDFLLSIDGNTPKCRRNFNDKVYVNILSLETKENFDGIFESHREYIDLHVIIQGEEKIYYGDRKDMTVTKEYDSQGDYELLKGDKYSAVDYTVMQGIECEINEPHMAGGCVADKQMMLKVIVKIRETSLIKNSTKNKY